MTTQVSPNKYRETDIALAKTLGWKDIDEIRVDGISPEGGERQFLPTWCMSNDLCFKLALKYGMSMVNEDTHIVITKKLPSKVKIHTWVDKRDYPNEDAAIRHGIVLTAKTIWL